MLLIRIRNNTCKALSPGAGSNRPVFNVVAIIIDMVTMVGEFYPNLHQGQRQKIKTERGKDGAGQAYGKRVPWIAQL